MDLLSHLSFQSWVTHLPICKGGLGIRRQVVASPIAYIGALEQTVPHFTGERGVVLSWRTWWEGRMRGRWAPLLDRDWRAGGARPASTHTSNPTHWEGRGITRRPFIYQTPSPQPPHLYHQGLSLSSRPIEQFNRFF